MLFTFDKVLIESLHGEIEGFIVVKDKITDQSTDFLFFGEGFKQANENLMYLQRKTDKYGKKQILKIYNCVDEDFDPVIYTLWVENWLNIYRLQDIVFEYNHFMEHPYSARGKRQFIDLSMADIGILFNQNHKPVRIWKLEE